MKSRPVHHPLAWDATGTAHLLFVAGDDAFVLARLLAEPPALAVDIIQAASLRRDDVDHAVQRLDAALGAAHMGLRLYIAAPEDVIWLAADVARRHGLHRSQLQTQCIGSHARPVFCVHCRTTTRAIATNIGPCAGCGRQLFVRDHFSRRLGAYMGFQVDAERPGELPEVEAVYR